MRKLITIILTIISISLNALATDDAQVLWTSINKDMHSFDTMMEHAAFIDIPKHELNNIATKLYPSNYAALSKQAHARIYYWKGWIATKINLDSAANYANKALALCDSTKYPYDYTRFSLLKADILRYEGNFAKAYFLYRNKIGSLKKFDDDFWQAKTNVSLGVIMQTLGEYPEALRYFTNAENLFKEAGSDACYSKNKINIANINYLLGYKQQGLAIITELQDSKFVTNDSIYLANVLVSKFQISDYKDTDAAIRAYNISQKIHDENLAVISRISMSTVYYNQGKFESAMQILATAYALAENMNDISKKRNILEDLEKCYRVMGQNKNADECKNKILILNDSIYHQESILNLKRAEHLATINEYESTIKEQNEKHRMRNILTLSISGFLLIVLVLSLWLLIASKKKNISDRKLQEEKNQRLQLINKQYSLDIEAKEKEIASNTVIIAQKNAKLKELAEQISKMEKHGEIASTESKILNDSISNELTDNDDWKFFKLKFDKVHPLFFTSLKETYPSLSKTELRLCAYIRIGMSAKEIAQILSVKPETINTSRYRIRKKMALKPEESLEAILENY